MDFRTIEQLAEITGKSRKTVDRKLIAFKKAEPERFALLTKKIQGTARLVYSDEILPILGTISNQIIEQVTKEVLKAPMKPPRVKKRKAPEIVTGQVISIDEHTPEEAGQMALFMAIMDKYKSGDYLLEDCITSNNVSREVFYKWISTDARMNAIYKEIYKEHKENSFRAIRELALQQLKKSITGYTMDLDSTTYIQKIGPNGEVINIPQEHRRQKKYVMPRSDLIMFALTNRDPDEWKRMIAARTLDGPKEADPMESMSDADLLGYLEQAKTKGFLTAGQDKDIL